MLQTRAPLRWGFVGTTLALVACTSTEQALIDRGFSPAYAAGYDQGCSSGQAAGGGLFAQAAKDEARYGSDSEYAKGWDEGFAKCKSDVVRMTQEARARKASRDDSPGH
jgi:hypothetical protein